MAKILMTVHRRQTILATEIPGPGCGSPTFRHNAVVVASYQVLASCQPDELSCTRSLNPRIPPVHWQKSSLRLTVQVSELEAFVGGFSFRFLALPEEVVNLFRDQAQPQVSKLS